MCPKEGLDFSLYDCSSNNNPHTDWREGKKKEQSGRERKEKSDYTSFIDASHHSCGVCPQYAVNPDSKL